MQLNLYGFISAVLDILPSKTREVLHKMQAKRSKKGKFNFDAIDEVQMIFKSMESIRKKIPLLKKKAINNYLCSEITLFGFK